MTICCLGLHDYVNETCLKTEIDNSSEFTYIIGHYLFRCKKCNKTKLKKFAIPYGTGTRWKFQETIEKAKNFKGLR